MKAIKVLLSLLIVLSTVALCYQEADYKVKVQKVIEGDTIKFENEEKTREKNKWLYDERQEEIPSQQQKHESNNWLLWLGVISGFLVAIGTGALAIATFRLVGQNKKQMEYILYEHSLKNILEDINAEIEQNLNIHEQIFGRFRSIYTNIESFEDLSSVYTRTYHPERIDIAPFDTTIWDGAKSKIIIKELKKLQIDYSPNKIKEIFENKYPFNITNYDIAEPPGYENFYHRLKATYSRVKILNELVYRLRYAISGQADQKTKLGNCLSVGNFKELLHDLVRAKSYLTQALDKL